MKFLHIAPDGAIIDIDVAKWLVGESVFIPTLEPRKAAKQVRDAMKISDNIKQQEWGFYNRPAYHDGKYGVRIWRIK